MYEYLYMPPLLVENFLRQQKEKGFYLFFHVYEILVYDSFIFLSITCNTFINRHLFVIERGVL